MRRIKVVIVGAGFAGVAAAQALSRLKNCDITIIDRRNFHLFQPLLYQVAMAGLSPSDISVPLRTLFRGRDNVEIILAEVDTIEVEKRQLKFENRWFEFDYLLVCTGAKHAYFGNNHWEDFAPGLKNIEQALEIRRRILSAFEQAEKAKDEIEQQKYLRFVIVGGGPTGVELAGAIAEMAAHTLIGDYKKADLSKTEVILVEAGPRVLSAFPESLSQKAERNLKDLGVRVMNNCRASDLSEDGLKLGADFVTAKTIIWAAGVQPSSLAACLPGQKDRQGRVVVTPTLSLPDFPNVFALGDLAAALGKDGNSLPGIAPVAIQQGEFVAKVIEADLKGLERPVFKYFDKGIMATIGRSKAVVSTGGWKFSGFLAWLAWVFVHIMYLNRFKNRIFVLLQWAWSYFFFGRGARLITYKTWRFYSGEKLKIR